MPVCKAKHAPKALPRGTQRGVSTVEYALLAVGVIAVVGAAIVLLEGGMLGLLDQVSDRMTAAVT